MPEVLKLSFANAIAYYSELLRQAAVLPAEQRYKIYARAALNDLFFLLVYVLHRKDCLHPWIYERCREVQANPDGCLDLWAREHFKSSIITFGLTIQTILKDPEVRIVIFSNTRTLAMGFLRQIKQEFETNNDLKLYFPDIIYGDANNAPKWSENDGITVKRKGNPKEATLEAWGLIDGMPTGKHFTHRIYDDVVTEKTLTPEMIRKVNDAIALSVDLGTVGGVERFIGTRYGSFDSYGALLDRKVLKPRIHPACPFERNGSNIIIHFDKSVFRDPQVLKDKYAKQGSYIFSCQQLQNPVADAVQQLNVSGLDTWDVAPSTGFNFCIIVDPASGKKSKSGKVRPDKELDDTVMLAMARGADAHWYLVDGMIDNRLDLTKRCEVLIALHRRYSRYGDCPVFYEDYGLQADIQHIEFRQKQINYHFKITPIGGSMAKQARIMRLQPATENGSIHLPRSLIRYNSLGQSINIVQLLKAQMSAYPIVQHDDILDCLSRIYDDEVERMVPIPQEHTPYDYQQRLLSTVSRRRNGPVV